MHMAQSRKSAAPRRALTARSRTGTTKGGGKIAVTIRLDAERVRRLQAVADAENRSLTNYVETALLRDLAGREEVDRVITMHVAPGVPTSIRPEDVIRAAGEFGRGLRREAGADGRTLVHSA